MSVVRGIARRLLGVFLSAAGMLHFAAADTFAAQVPDWFPVDTGLVVALSGVVEIVLGVALVAVPGRHVATVRRLGWVVAAFFVAVFPGNVAQYVEGTSAFGLDTDGARLTRLFFQPLLVLWALAACDALPFRRRDRHDRADRRG
ncbi:DoxX family protein [Nocardioides alkalitolerans]|uniref:DoxX family protein n=1 Tax=Nocardioides alkalitolerans TaxID=281714 RepID=UPI0003F582B7|nr:membrane protein [Nocardioides alkalitolerans]